MSMVNKKEWAEFRKTGLLLFINFILHVFGWALVYEIGENEEILSVYPARVKFRGFDSEHISESYVKITEHLKDNIEFLLNEAKDD